jgi:hypothetical protein
MFKLNTPEKVAARTARAEAFKATRAEAKEKKAAGRAGKVAGKADLKKWRAAHPAERQLNEVANVHPLWPGTKFGMTAHGPVAGGVAEFFSATDRRSRGVAAVNITFGNGAARSWNVKADRLTLQAANKYVAAFNVLSAQLAAEQDWGRV